MSQLGVRFDAHALPASLRRMVRTLSHSRSRSAVESSLLLRARALIIWWNLLLLLLLILLVLSSMVGVCLLAGWLVFWKCGQYSVPRCNQSAVIIPRFGVDAI